MKNNGSLQTQPKSGEERVAIHSWRLLPCVVCHISWLPENPVYANETKTGRASKMRPRCLEGSVEPLWPSSRALRDRPQSTLGVVVSAEDPKGAGSLQKQVREQKPQVTVLFLLSPPVCTEICSVLERSQMLPSVRRDSCVYNPAFAIPKQILWPWVLG